MDIIKNIIKSITYKPYITELSEKYTSDVLINENDIDLLFPARVFSDTSTGAYTSVFLKDNLIKFADYLYNKLYVDIHSNINDNLIKKSLPVINDDENIILIFKGGNVMHFYFNDIIYPIIKEKTGATLKYTDLKGNIESLDFVEYLNDISVKNFSISDVDFSICIKTDNIKRYDQIYIILLEILNNSFDDISKMFDKYYNYALENETLELEESIINTPLDNNLSDIIESGRLLAEIFKKLKYIEDNKFVNRETLTQCPNLKELKYIKLDEVYNTRSAYILELKSANVDNVINIISAIKLESCSIIKLSKILWQCQQIIYLSDHIIISNVSIIKKLVPKIKDIMIKIRNYKFNELIKGNFYTKDKINMYVEKLKEKFNELNKNNCHFSKSRSEVKILKMKEGSVGNEDININKKNNFKVIASDDPFSTNNIEIESSKRIHYVSFNRSIHTMFSKYDLNFDLMRIKFNTNISNNFNVKKYSNTVTETTEHNVPSEFLDVSIPNYSDYYRKHYVDDIKYIKLHEIPSYNIAQVYEDLLFVLYKQSYIVPWTDKKYEKRIGRSLIFGMMIDTQFINFTILNKLIELIYNHINNNKEFPYQYICDMDIIFINKVDKNNKCLHVKYIIDNLVYGNYDNILINEKYENIRDYLVNIIYFGSFNNKKNSIYLKFINNSRKAYCRNIIKDEYAESYVNEYKESFNNLLIIMHRYINIFSQIIKEKTVYDNILKYKDSNYGIY